MADYNEWGFKSDAGFFGAPQQICASVNHFRKTNEAAISANTKAIYDQTERMISAMTIMTNTQHEDSVAMKNQQKSDAEEQRNTITNVFAVLTKTVRNIFTKDKGDMIGETFYEMMQRESDETQQYISAHTKMVKSESDETQTIISGSNKTVKDSLNGIESKLSAHTQSIVSELEGIKSLIKENTSGGTINAAVIAEAINNLEIRLNPES